MRYAEVDGQGVVFNSHYLLWCDEAMSLFCRERGLLTLAEQVRLKSSSLTWVSGAKWGETVHVLARCTNVGRTSFRIEFGISVDARSCCDVTTTYVLTDGTGRPVPLQAEEREALIA